MLRKERVDLQEIEEKSGYQEDKDNERNKEKKVEMKKNIKKQKERRRNEKGQWEKKSSEFIERHNDTADNCRAPKYGVKVDVFLLSF